MPSRTDCDEESSCVGFCDTASPFERRRNDARTIEEEPP